MAWNVETRETCKQCNSKIDRSRNKRLRSFCSTVCRNRALSKKWQKYRIEITQKKNDKIANIPNPDKKKCGICGRWYRRVARHVNQRHGITAREYKTDMGIPVGRGILGEAGRDRMREVGKNPNSIEALKAHAKSYQYKKNDPRTRDASNPWGSGGRPHDEHY